MADTQDLKLAQTTFKLVCAMLDDNEWHYDRDDEKLMISCTAQGKDLPLEITMRVNPDLEIVTLISPMSFNIPNEKRNEIAVAVAFANYGMVDGSFDYNYTTGRLLFRMTTSYAGSVLSKDVFDYMLFVSCATIDKYNDRFLNICKNAEMTVEQIKSLIDAE